MNSESEQIWRWYFHLTDHFLIFIFAPQLCKRTFLTLENESTSCNPCLDMRPLQRIQCQDNLGITWTLFNLVYRDFIHENTCTIMECLPVSSILCAWGGKLILSTTCASGLFVYICLFERCVPACMQRTERNLSFYHVGGPWNWTQLPGLMASTFTQWNHLTGPVSQFCSPFHHYMTNSEVIQLFPPVPWANQNFRVKWYIHVVPIFLTCLHDKHAVVFIVFYHIYAKAVMKFCIVSEHGNLVKGEG